jgi:hypothetical protein
MPGYYPEGGGGPGTILGGDVEKQVEAIVDYLMYLANGGSVVMETPEQKVAPEGENPQASL